MAQSAFRLGELAAQFGCELIGDPEARVSSIAPLASALSGTISFFANKAYRDQLRATAATAVLIRAADVEDCPVNALIAEDPYLAYARIATVLHPSAALVAGVHSSAVVAPSATVAASAQLAANCVIEDDAVIAEHVYVGPGVVVGPRCTVGRASRLQANATLVQDVDIGERCIVHQGVVVGSDGFGNAQGPSGWVKVPQIGGVRIGNDVEIGANSAIDRGAIDDTVLENGVRIDNLVHIAHNVRIGEHTAMAAFSGVSGSSVIGKRCMVAGMAGIVGHVTICDDVIVGGKAVISKDVKEPGYYSGTFIAEKDKDWKRKVAHFKRLEGLVKRVRELEKTVNELTADSSDK